MTLLAEILARIAYDEVVKDVKERDSNESVPTFDEVKGNADVCEFTEMCANDYREYLRRKYGK
jgi:hypothetical protein